MAAVLPLMALETDEIETPAARATSLMVVRLEGFAMLLCLFVFCKTLY